MNLTAIDWIWHVRGDVPLAPALSGEDALDRLSPLFRQTGTSYERMTGLLRFRKQDPAAQDKMSVFDSGTLQVEQAPEGSVLRYRLSSKALLYCFLAPLLFLALAQVTIGINMLGKAPDKAASAKPEPEAKPIPMNPIDKALGAPEPEQPKKAGAKGGTANGGGGGDADEDGPRNRKPSPTPAYVFAGIFAVLYLVGRLLEDRLVKALFRKTLAGA